MLLHLMVFRSLSINKFAANDALVASSLAQSHIVSPSLCESDLRALVLRPFFCTINLLPNDKDVSHARKDNEASEQSVLFL